MDVVELADVVVVHGAEHPCQAFSAHAHGLVEAHGVERFEHLVFAHLFIGRGVHGAEHAGELVPLQVHGLVEPHGVEHAEGAVAVHEAKVLCLHAEGRVE